MTTESLEVRLARIEEGQNAINTKIDGYHETVTKSMAKLAEDQAEDHDDVTTLKNDRKWLFSLAGFGATSALYTLLHFIK